MNPTFGGVMFFLRSTEIMSIIRSVFNGLAQAMGLRIGLAGMRKGEVHIENKKRFAITLIYLFFLVYYLYKSFSFRSKERGDHVFWVWLDKNDWFVLLTQKFGFEAYNPGNFAIYTAIIAGVATAFVLFVNMRDGKPLTLLPKFWYVVLFVCYCPLAYALVYDPLYFWMGNGCLFSSSNFLCMNYTNTADDFATMSLWIYFLRSVCSLLPEEKGTILFSGNNVADIFGGALFLLPTLPAPHTICVPLYYMYNYLPGAWDLYRHPDGRENAVQEHIRYK